MRKVDLPTAPNRLSWNCTFFHEMGAAMAQKKSTAKGFQARLDMADARRRTIKAVYKDPCTGFGSIAQTLQQAQVRDPSFFREKVKAFLDLQ